MDKTTTSQSLENGLELPDSPRKIPIKDRIQVLESLRGRTNNLDEQQLANLALWLAEIAGSFNKKPAEATQQQLVNLALDTSIAVPEPMGFAITAQLVKELVSGKHTINVDTVVSAFSTRKDASAITTSILINHSSENREDSHTFLLFWQKLLPPLLGSGTNSSRVSSEHAVRILARLANLEVEAIPGELSLMLGRLAIVAGADAMVPIQPTDLGKLIEKLYPGITRPTPVKTETAVVTADDPHQSFVSTITKQFREYIAGLDKDALRLRNNLETVNNRALELTTEIDRLNTDIRREKGLRKEREASLQGQISQLEAEKDNLKKQVLSLSEERDRWQQETRLTEKGSASSLELRIGEYRDRVRGNLTRPLREVQGVIERMLGQEPTIKQVRLVAANLDKMISQMVKIGVFGENEVKRISREQFMKSGSSTDK